MFAIVTAGVTSGFTLQVVLLGPEKAHPPAGLLCFGCTSVAVHPTAQNGGVHSLAFLTPVWGRYSLTRICLAQRRWVCDELRSRYGIDATTIVIGDDENLDVAHRLGFLTVMHDNSTLARKFNAGYVAAHQEGIDMVFPIGSDSWIDPDYFDTLPEPGELLLSRAYNLVTSDGQRRGALWIHWEGGVQWTTHVTDWAHRNYRPISEVLKKGCDSSTWLHRGKSLVLREHHHHQLEYVAFQSPEKQITDYTNIMNKYGTAEVEGAAVFDELRPFFRNEDIQAVRGHYAMAHIERLEEAVAEAERTADRERAKLAEARELISALAA